MGVGVEMGELHKLITREKHETEHEKHEIYPPKADNLPLSKRGN